MRDTFPGAVLSATCGLLLSACSLQGGPAEDPDDVDTDDPSDPGDDDEDPIEVDTSKPSLQVESNVILEGFDTTRYTWIDSRGEERAAAMTRNDEQDPTGNYGGGLRRLTFTAAGEQRTATGLDSTYPSFGVVVNHYDNTASVSDRVAGTGTTYFNGPHHAIHEFKWRLSMGGEVDVTVWWIFSSGRDHPIYAITYDAQPAGENVVSADSRSPYGELLFDNDKGGDVDRLGWGDRYRFRTLGDGPVTLQSGWSYADENRIPHVLMASVAENAEMGLVQTHDWERQDAGGYWFYPSWGQTASTGPMPENWNWTYQLNQYELPFTTASHRMAWGSNYGAVGQASYEGYGDDRQLSGYPFQSYAVQVALGALDVTENLVDGTRAVVEAEFSCATGSAATMVAGGAGRTDLISASPRGYSNTFAGYVIEAAADHFDCTLDLGEEETRAPLFVVRGYAGSKAPKIDGAYVSLDDDRDTLYVTVAGKQSGRLQIAN